MAVPMTTTVWIFPLMWATSWGSTIKGEARVTPGVREMRAASACGNTPTDWMRPADALASTQWSAPTPPTVCWISDPKPPTSPARRRAMAMTTPAPTTAIRN